MNSYVFPMITEEASLPFYVTGAGGLENQTPITRPNGYYDFQWLHCIRGKGILHIDEKEFILSKNSGFFMYPDVPHQYYAIEEPWETHWVVFNGEGVISLLNSLGMDRYHVYHLDDVRMLDNLISDIFILTQTKGPMPGHRNSAKLYNLLIELNTLVREKAEKDETSKLKRLLPVLDFIEENYATSPTINELSDIIGVSPQYLCRIFSQVLNTRPTEYLNLFKLKKAKEMLFNEIGLTVKEIAQKTGFNDPSYFCAIFKKYEGITPMQFRR